MDKLTPNLVDENGLPTYPPHIEQQILRTFEAGRDPSDQIEDLVTTWIWERAAVIRGVKQVHAGHQEKVHREMGWETRKQRYSKKRKSSNEDTRGNGQNSPVGPVETRTAKRKRMQGSVPGKRRKGQQH